MLTQRPNRDPSLQSWHNRDTAIINALVCNPEVLIWVVFWLLIVMANRYQRRVLGKAAANYESVLFFEETLSADVSKTQSHKDACATSN